MTEKITEDRNYFSSSSVYRGGVSKADGGVYTTIFKNYPLRLLQKTIENDLQGLLELPLLTPPYTGGGEVSLRLWEVTKRSLPLCKGEPEGVVLVREVIFNFQFCIFNCLRGVVQSFNLKFKI